METCELTQEDFQSLIDCYEKRIESTFDALVRVQNASMELTDYLNGQKPLTDRKEFCGFRNILRMMSPYTNRIPSYLRKMKRGEVPELPREMIIKLEDISKEAGDWRTMFNATVRDYKELRELYKQSFYNSDGTFDFAGWIP